MDKCIWEGSSYCLPFWTFKGWLPSEGSTYGGTEEEKIMGWIGPCVLVVFLYHLSWGKSKQYWEMSSRSEDQCSPALPPRDCWPFLLCVQIPHLLSILTPLQTTDGNQDSGSPGVWHCFIFMFHLSRQKMTREYRKEQRSPKPYSTRYGIRLWGHDVESQVSGLQFPYMIAVPGPPFFLFLCPPLSGLPEFICILRWPVLPLKWAKEDQRQWCFLMSTWQDLESHHRR